MPQKAEESHEEYRARQQAPKPTVLPTEQSDPKPGLEGRVEALENLIQRIIDACCKHHSGLCRDLEGPKTDT